MVRGSDSCLKRYDCLQLSPSDLKNDWPYKNVVFSVKPFKIVASVPRLSLNKTQESQHHVNGTILEMPLACNWNALVIIATAMVWKLHGPSVLALAARNR